MIEALRNWLIEQNLVLAHHRVEFCYRLCGNWSLLCYQNQMLRYFIKIENFSAILDEYKTLRFMHSVMPQRVLEPICYGQMEGKSIYVQRAMPHQAMPGACWLQEPMLQTQMRDFFLTLARFRLKNPAHIDERIMAPYKKYLPKGYASHLSHFQLPQVLQHGDLSLNNLGMTHEGKILIFDWEDYGLSALPVMDLTVFLMSVFDFSVDAFYQAIQQPQLQAWIQPILLAFKLDLGQYLYLMPYALMIFLSLKQQLGYGPEIIQRVDHCIRLLIKAIEIKAHEGVVCA